MAVTRMAAAQEASEAVRELTGLYLLWAEEGRQLGVRWPWGTRLRVRKYFGCKSQEIWYSG